MVRTSQASVVKLTSACDTFRSVVTARTSKFTALRAWPPISASEQSQSEYYAVVCEPDYSVLILRSLVDHTSCVKEDFADLFHRTCVSRLSMQTRKRPLFEDLWLQPGPANDMNEKDSAPTE